ncbi:hypothetical protein PSTG_18077, partial [Puccinia striiformis f. sp. tritici PST-78]
MVLHGWCGGWDDAKDDDANHRWLVHLYDRLAALSCGYYINEFDLEARSGNVERCYTSEGWQRLNTLRQHYDPAGKDWDTRLQIAIVLSRPEKNQPKTLILNTLAFADSEEESAALQAGLIQNIPVNLITLLAKTTCKGFDDIHQQYASMQTGRRFRSDNIITDQIQLATAVLDVFLPEQPAQDGITRLVWRGKQTFPDAAYAVKGQFLVSTYLQWDDAKDDDANHRWLVHLYDRLAALSCGYYINEFDLEARSGNVERCYTSE